MPLVTLSGIPLSGKTTRARQLEAAIASYLRQNTLTSFRNVILVNEESLKLNKMEIYKDANEEKKARGALMSAVERFLTKEDIVICDSLNYIKGYRYQLYCVARALGTPACTLLCGLQASDSESRNTSQNTPVYDQDTLVNLCSRFEDPDGRNRWDAPLFTVISQDEPLDAIDEQGSLSHQVTLGIIDAILFKKAPPPNLSTVVKPLTETNYLHEMDKTTSDILGAILEAQKNGIQGHIKVPKASESKKVLIPSRTLTLSELRRIRRDFTKMNKVRVSLGSEAIADTFVEYLNTKLD